MASLAGFYLVAASGGIPGCIRVVVLCCPIGYIRCPFMKAFLAKIIWISCKLCIEFVSNHLRVFVDVLSNLCQKRRPEGAAEGGAPCLQTIHNQSAKHRQ